MCKIIQFERLSFLNSNERVIRIKVFGQTILSYRLPQKTVKTVYYKYNN